MASSAVAVVYKYVPVPAVEVEMKSRHVLTLHSLRTRTLWSYMQRDTPPSTGSFGLNMSFRLI